MGVGIIRPRNSVQKAMKKRNRERPQSICLGLITSHKSLEQGAQTTCMYCLIIGFPVGNWVSAKTQNHVVHELTGKNFTQFPGIQQYTKRKVMPVPRTGNRKKYRIYEICT